MVGSARTRDFIGDVSRASFTLMFGRPVTDEIGVPMLKFAIEGTGKCTVHRQLGMRSFTLPPSTVNRLFERFIAEGFTVLASPAAGVAADDLIYFVTLSNGRGHTRKLGRAHDPHPQFDRLVASLLDELDQHLAAEHREALRAWLQPLKPLTRQYRAETDVGLEDASDRTRAFIGDPRRAIVTVTFPGVQAPGAKTTAFMMRGTGEVLAMTLWWDLKAQCEQQQRADRLISVDEVDAILADYIEAGFTEVEVPEAIRVESATAHATHILELTNESGQTHEIRYAGSHEVLDFLAMRVAETAWKRQRRWWQFWR